MQNQARFKINIKQAGQVPGLGFIAQSIAKADDNHLAPKPRSLMLRSFQELAPMGSSQDKLSLNDSGVGINLVFQKKREPSSPFQNSTIINLMKKKDEKSSKKAHHHSSNPSTRESRKKYTDSPKRRLPRLDGGNSIEKSPRNSNE